MANQILLAVGGQNLNAHAVELFPSPRVAEWRRLAALAQQQLGGVSTGLSFWGSPGWAIGGAVALGMLETALSNSKAKEGLVTLQRANEALRGTRKAGKMFRVSDIQDIGIASPSAWSGKGEGRRRVEMSEIAFLDRGKFLKEHGLTKHDVSGGVVHLPETIHYLTLGEEFLTLMVENQGEVQVRWSAVETFRLA